MLCRSIHSLESIELNFIFPPPSSSLLTTLLIIACITLFGHLRPNRYIRICDVSHLVLSIDR